MAALREEVEQLSKYKAECAQKDMVISGLLKETESLKKELELLKGGGDAEVVAVGVLRPLPAKLSSAVGGREAGCSSSTNVLQAGVADRQGCLEKPLCQQDPRDVGMRSVLPPSGLIISAGRGAQGFSPSSETSSLHTRL